MEWNRINSGWYRADPEEKPEIGLERGKGLEDGVYSGGDFEACEMLP